MKRIAATVATLAAAAAALTLAAVPAQAASNNLRPYNQCVASTWRAQHAHQPKTVPGQFCVGGKRAIWIPKDWKHVGNWLDDSGKVWPIYCRPVYIDGHKFIFYPPDFPIAPH